MKHLSLEQVIKLHNAILEPGEPDSFDHSRVRSIIATIQGGIGQDLFHATVPEAAAAYLFYFARSQAFTQGNKRTAVITCDVFLDANNAPLQTEIDENFVVAVAKGDKNKNEVIEYLNELISLPEPS